MALLCMGLFFEKLRWYPSPYHPLEERIHSGAAFAALATDYQDADKMRIEGSPSLVLNEGRQKLYGNVGFRVIEANVQGLLHAAGPEDASWC